MPSPTPDLPKNVELLQSLIDIEGSSAGTYGRFHSYSRRNIGFLALQCCPPAPVATYARWAELGYHVKRGEKAYSILRPIQVRVKGETDEEEERFIRRFKVVRALFHFGQVAGDGELPPYTPPAWDESTALTSLNVTRMPYEMYNGNIQGYSEGRNLAVSPVARYPFKTLHHELGLALEHMGQ